MAVGNGAGNGTGTGTEGNGADIAVVCDRFPQLSETFIAQEALALRRQGWNVHIEATNRATQADLTGLRQLSASFAEDDPPSRRMGALVLLVARHPLGCARDLVARLRWRREEYVLPLRALAPVARRVRRARCVHLHAHFAAGAALTALRLHRLLGLPYSVTAHAYDIYAEPRNLVPKLREAAFATSGCDYTVRDLREVAGPDSAPRIHKVIMGVDGTRLLRTTPYPGGRTVIAVGRLVEKKGFADLVTAAADLHGIVERIWIVGDGPLRGALERAIAERGVGELVELMGPRQPADVLALIEQADVLCMPCVVAANGDRDSMPVVVKEALALEVPVVATDEVGLPEVVRPEWGTLVPPGDPRTLARALRELLELPADERTAMGRAGRAFVVANCNVDREAAKLAGLIDVATRS